LSKLSGVITAIPTPLHENENVDVEGLRNVIEYVIEEGVSGIFVLGSMGEGPALLDSQKQLVVEVAAERINGRVPLLAGISEVSTRRTLELGKAVQNLNPDYLVTTTPFYYTFPHPKSIIEFMTRLDVLEKPIIFYNCPSMTGNRVGIHVMEKILNMPHVAAVKDSSGDTGVFFELLRRYPDKKTRPCGIFQGDEFMFDISLFMGADGVVTGGGTLFVETLVRLYTCAISDDTLGAFKQQQEFRMKMDKMLGPELLIDWVHAVKRELEKKGLCGAKITSPFLERC
jgi:4-hydroxy-tetrahydrodipicolinate synthase